MASPWIARIILSILVVEVGLCTAFLADHWSPLREREEWAFRLFINSTAQSPLGHVIDPSPPSQRERLVRLLAPGRPSSYLRVDITDDPERVFEQSPPSATDWAVILNRARAEPPGVAAIDHPLSWENAGEIPLLTLDHQLSLYKSAVLCVDLRRAPVGQTLPTYLARSAIPLSQLQGNIGLLPRVNRLVLPPSATGAPNTLFGFRLLESEEETDPSTPNQAPPAFARWGEVLIPSFPLALAMAQHGISPDQVEIKLGSHVRLGLGPVIPLDHFGRILLPRDARGYLQLPPPEDRRISFATADALDDAALIASFANHNGPDCTLFTKATGTTSSPWRTPTILQNMAGAIDILPQPGPAEAHPRFPLWLEILILLTLALLGVTALQLHRSTRLLAFPLLLLTLAVSLAAVLDLHGSWTPFTPLLTGTLTAWFLCSRLAKHLPPPTSQLPTSNF